MELKIYNPQEAGFVQKIEWNFEELKKEVTAAAQSYASTVYTDDAIKAAKADRAKLNKFVDALEGKRTEIRKQLLAPDEQFGREIKELTGIIQSAIKNIDGQVKDYEERQRKARLLKIREFYDANINDLEPFLPFERVVRPEYGNASKTMKSIQAEIRDLIQRVSEGLAVLNEVESRYAGDMKEVFLRTYDIGQALAEKNRLEAEEEKRRVYEEEMARAAEKRRRQLQNQAKVVSGAGRPADPEGPAVSVGPAVSGEPQGTAEEKIYVLDFRVHATAAQLAGLKQYLNQAGIRFEPVPKK